MKVTRTEKKVFTVVFKFCYLCHFAVIISNTDREIKKKTAENEIIPVLICMMDLLLKM
jgi:hypothetical protein